MLRQFGEDLTRSSADMLADRLTDVTDVINLWRVFPKMIPLQAPLIMLRALRRQNLDNNCRTSTSTMSPDYANWRTLSIRTNAVVFKMLSVVASVDAELP